MLSPSIRWEAVMSAPVRAWESESGAALGAGAAKAATGAVTRLAERRAASIERIIVVFLLG
jgi:hypothetical protein